MACQMFTTGSLLHGNWRRNLILNLWEHFPSIFSLFVPRCFLDLLTSAKSATRGLSQCLFISALEQDVLNLPFIFLSRQGTARSSNKIILKLTIALTIFDQLNRKLIKWINENILKHS